MMLMQMVGQNLQLGDLEAECRESLSTDGGGDASSLECSAGNAMGVALACSQETAADSMFCNSACFAVLAPWYEVCQAEIPTYMQAMMQVPLSLMQQCDADAPAAAVCDMTALMTACMADSGLDTLDPNNPMAACANPCITQLFPCLSNPMLAMMFGADAMAGFEQLNSMCNADASDGGPGDGVCQIGTFLAMSADPAMDPDLCNQDITCTCSNGLTQEMLDCKDDPVFADSRDQIAPIEALCAGVLAGAGSGGPGDGVCDIAAVVHLAQDPTMDPSTCGGDLMCLCNNAVLKEMFDCQDDPSAAIFLADSADQLRDLHGTCAAVATDETAGVAGDHVCNELSASMLCDEGTLALATSGTMSGAEMCSHPCAQEMIDCIDSPLLAENRAAILHLAQVCSSSQSECLPIVANMNSYFDEACCTGAGLEPCTDGPPATCTTGCSAMYLPFWRDCGSVVTGLGQGSDDFAQVAMAMENFNTICTTAHPTKTRPVKVVPGGH